MKRISFGLVALGLLFMMACKSNTNQYTINGELTNLKDSVLYLGRQASGMPVFDTLKVKNGKFTFTGEASNPDFAQILTADRQNGFPIFLEPGTITVKGDADSLLSGDVTVAGTPNNDALQEFMDLQKPYMPKMQSLQSEYMKAQNEGDSDRMEEIGDQIEEITKVITDDMQGFIKDHPQSVISAVALQTVMQSLDDDTVEELYANLDTTIQNSTFGQGIGSKIASTKTTGVGKEAPDFTLDNPEGKPFSLSSLRGKYVLIDFWASWCAPCRVENPNVVETYKKYKDKGFTILGVSLDNDKDAWIAAIKDDNLNWDQVSDLQKWDNSAARLYGVQAIPANFLLDPDGKIIAKDLRGAALKDKLAEVLQ